MKYLVISLHSTWGRQWREKRRDREGKRKSGNGGKEKGPRKNGRQEREEGKRPVVEGWKKGQEGMGRKNRKESGGEPPLRSERRAPSSPRPVLPQRPLWISETRPLSCSALFLTPGVFVPPPPSVHPNPNPLQGLPQPLKPDSSARQHSSMTWAQSNHFLFKLLEHPS